MRFVGVLDMVLAPEVFEFFNEQYFYTNFGVFDKLSIQKNNDKYKFEYIFDIFFALSRKSEYFFNLKKLWPLF